MASIRPAGVPSRADAVAPLMFLLALLHLVILGSLLHWWNIDPLLDRHDRELTLKLVLVIWAPFLLEGLWAAVSTAAYPQKARRTLLPIILPATRLAVSPHVDAGWIWLPGLGWRSPGRDLYRQLERLIALPMLAVTLLILPILAIEFLLKEYVAAYSWLDLLLNLGIVAVWIAFAVELTIMLSISPDRMRYLKRHWINVLIVFLPALAFLRSLQLLRLAQVAGATRILKVYRLRSLLLRGYESLLALSVLERILHRNPEKLRAKLLREIEHKELELEELRLRLEQAEKEIEKRTRENPE